MAVHGWARGGSFLEQAVEEAGARRQLFGGKELVFFSGVDLASTWLRVLIAEKRDEVEWTPKAARELNQYTLETR